LNSNNSFRFSKRIRDIVIVRCQVRKGNMTWDKEVIINSDDHFSAMQRATGFSIAAVADLIARGDIQASGNHLKYADIPFEKFANSLTYLGIKV
jgi:saccharopine dehydrogenase-like NADP-dependent oxidoreductase